jgi:hypothetical protein
MSHIAMLDGTDSTTWLGLVTSEEHARADDAAR